MDVGYALVIEFKAVDKLNSIYTAQLISYLKMSGYPLGLLITNKHL